MLPDESVSKSAARPTFRLLVLGAPQSGRTTYLKGLASQYGTWMEERLTAKIQTSLCLFSLREIPLNGALSAIAQKYFSIDGVILFCDLSAPLRADVVEVARFTAATHTPIRLIVATHRDAFGDEQELLDECELSLRESLSAVGVSTDAIPIVHTSLDDPRERECLDKLHALDWGPPLTEKPALMWSNEARSVTRSESLIGVKLLRGSLQRNAPLEAFSWGMRMTRGAVLSCSHRGEELSIARAPGEYELRVSSIHTMKNSLLTAPQQMKVSNNARAQIFLSSSEASSRMRLMRVREIMPLAGPFLNESATIVLPNITHLELDTCYSVRVELEVDSPSFLFCGLWFSWRCEKHQGEGIITSLD